MQLVFLEWLPLIFSFGFPPIIGRQGKTNINRARSHQSYASTRFFVFGSIVLWWTREVLWLMCTRWWQRLSLVGSISMWCRTSRLCSSIYLCIHAGSLVWKWIRDSEPEYDNKWNDLISKYPLNEPETYLSSNRACLTQARVEIFTSLSQVAYK